MDIESLNDGSSFRMLKIKEALIQGFSIDEIYQNTGIDPWFLHEIAEIVSVPLEKSNLVMLILWGVISESCISFADHGIHFFPSLYAEFISSSASGTLALSVNLSVSLIL